jgi:serine/threonine protein kinase
MAEVSKTRIGRYELLLPPVGEGSEGLLYKAHPAEDGVPGVSRGESVALKRLRHIGREMRPDRFQRQAELLRKLSHPNIVQYKDSFVWRDEESDEGIDVYCLVTEWLEGQTLKALIEEHPAGVPWEIAEGILRQVLQALTYASAKRVVHRDLKPSNIYLVHEGTDEFKVKLIDFGIARPMDAEATTTSTTASFEGTWHWMAPDFVRLQEDNFRGDERSDIYSFGVCCYQVLTGKFPYGATGDNPQFAYFQRWLATTPPKMAPHPNFSVLKGSRSCIQKCLETDRDKRYRSFEELLEDFSKIKYRQLRHTPDVYEYRRYLGQGGFGQVFYGRRLSDGHEVAIKELVAGQHARRFVREAKILQKAPHAHLVQYLDFVEVQATHIGDDAKYFLVLEYLEGMPSASLRERIKKADAELEPREVLALFCGYLECLEHLHQHPDHIIHRDIKPGNLYAPVGAPDKGKLFDLGIAHDEEGTRTHGQVPGTLDYMPPEFAAPDSGRGSPQSDIYSLAVTLYEALTRNLPFPRLPSGEKAWVEYITRSLQPVECSFDHRVFGEHPELVSLLRPGLARDPLQRFPSAKAMRDEIQKVLASWDGSRNAYQAAMAEARAAFQREDFHGTEWQARRALEIQLHDLSAEHLLTQARKRREELCESAVTLAQAACDRKNYPEAQRQAQLALNLQPGDPAAEQVLARVQHCQQEMFDTAVALAQAAWKNKDYSEVQHQLEQALKVRPNDETATHLLAQVREEQQRIQDAASRPKAAAPVPILLETQDRAKKLLA